MKLFLAVLAIHLSLVASLFGQATPPPAPAPVEKKAEPPKTLAEAVKVIETQTALIESQKKAISWMEQKIAALNQQMQGQANFFQSVLKNQDLDRQQPPDPGVAVPALPPSPAPAPPPTTTRPAK